MLRTVPQRDPVFSTKCKLGRRIINVTTHFLHIAVI